MTIDMEQFKATYIEESLEGLDAMESSLLELEVGSQDQDAINTIFRAAHSIKGGGATFGFQAISEFTHVVETLLDQIRNGDREVTQQARDLFLQSVDCIREMLDSSREGGTPETSDKIDEVKHQLDLMLKDNISTDVSVSGSVGSTTESNASGGWKIHFKPHPDMLSSGNDVVRMFRELSELGEFKVCVNHEALPSLVDLVPEECYLSWNLELRGDVTKAQIDDVFVWVEDDCELNITPLMDAEVGAVTSETVQSQNGKGEDLQPVVTAATPSVEHRHANDRRSGDERRNVRASTESSSIRVDIEKIDALINMVGELVITQSMLSQLGEDFDMERLEKLQDGLGQLERNTRELQESVMRIRMIPISFAFNRFPRMIHDMCNKLDKKVQLKLTGESTELDKTVMEKIGDPLVHLVRNSMDHGIEMPEARVKAGKPETGTVHLNAYHQGGNIVIEISDDGAGLNREKILKKAVERGLLEDNVEIPDHKIYDLIFHPGFSTADKITDVSGRGVGMDVVKKNIQALGGSVDISSEAGKGSKFTIRLPLTLAILDGQLIRVGEQIYIIPLVSIIESLQMHKRFVNAVAGRAEVYKLRDDYIPIVRLAQAFGIEAGNQALENGLLVVVEGDQRKVGLLVDDLLAQQQVVIKSLETNYKKVEGLSGATILGDGTVALIIDVAGIIRVTEDGPNKPGLSVVSDNDVAAA